MNEVIREAAEQSSHTWLVGVVTVLFMAFFIATIAWAYRSRSKDDLDEAARLPLDNDEEDF